MENRKKKLSEVETLVAVICQNVPKYTRKTNNDLKLHALVTKQKKDNLKNVYWLFKNEL